MNLSVPANYDINLVPRLAQYPVDEVYGKLPSDFVGGGRASYMAGKLTGKSLAEYVACLHDHKIEFNYLLNSACLANREWSKRWQKKLNSLLAKLAAMGIHRLTVSSPYLLQRIKATFPEFHIRVGIFAQIDSPRRARFWEDLGAEALTLESFSINRDFQTLKSIRSAVSCQLHLIANHPCLPNCPMQYYHQNCFAHASDGNRGLFIDYCFLKCTSMRLTDPSYLIKAAWIRPEDVSFYEHMGYTHFKLLERDIPSDELLKRIECYTLRQSPQDLAELILPYGFRQKQKKERFWLIKHFLKPFQINPFKLVTLYKLAHKAGMLFPTDRKTFQILSSKLPADFLGAFEKVCCRMDNCKDCHYCETIARDAVLTDTQQRQELLELLGRMEKHMITGSLWGV
jgi:collagenase-like PrtC family protease